MSKKTGFKKPLFTLLYISFLLIGAEAILRFCFPMPQITNFNRINYQILAYQNNKANFIRNIKMLWRSSLDIDEDFIYTLNTYGYRDKEWDIEKDKDNERIMFVGDSFVEGMMAQDDHTIPIGFHEAAARQGQSVEAMNFGMMGIGLNEYIKLIVDAVPIFKPDHVCLVLFSNDIPFNRPYFPSNKIKPNMASFNTPRLLDLIKQSKKKDPIPFRWSTQSKRYWKPVPDRSNPWSFHHDSLIQHVQPHVADVMCKGDFNFFRTNWILEEERFLKAPTDLTEKLKMLNDYILQNGSSMSVYYIPSRNQVSTYYYQFEKEYCIKNCPDQMELTQPAYQVHRTMLSSNCSSLGIPFYDLTGLVKQEEDIGNHLYWHYDDHMRGEGYLMLGEAIFDRWNTNYGASK